ncbi:hypothetical protein PHLGIDRAFT_330001 [Phlebiopsis gigantea 11061_1 CR5-6]|uniref:DNA 3'-5' helicase n=1 Tax=Phlebiopsis gigantea (strain 11061_1 CR5-6) TaxID=745531 RepID=A0A0C3PWG1_PHLG1|nr:hypothetical protein PHLGIDRAFT_330001 [Phlebiopsis gigantea 11061_1 CR5-6]
MRSNQYNQSSQAYSHPNERSPYGEHVPSIQRQITHTGPEQRGSRPRNTHGIRLRPTSDLPDMYRALFKFGVFNAVQSTCYDMVMHSDNNMVVSAPTGSGKTVLFELAIIRMLIESGKTGRQSKCVYVAPTKALCSEKHRDWTTKFQSLGINCCELTGDTVQFGQSAWGDAKRATVIVTTGEKWDSLTRNWDDHQQILSQIHLFLVDEVHILNETRGSTLEVVISRMKFRGNSVRFALVSATVPNIQDVAAWIGNGSRGKTALVEEFGEEYRPCKLARHVVSVYKKKDTNDFMYQNTLDFKLYGVLQTYSADKPVLVFCTTRKGVVASAERLMKEYESSLHKKERLPWTKPGRVSRSFHDKRLGKLAEFGIGVHHAGMTMDDRRTTEELFLQKVLRVITATSTLAVGVNLPAHTVIIKGVKLFQGGARWAEYSDLDIMQMMGRAGRPQFDKEGVAVIMCEPELEAKYQSLAHGTTLLESSLHTNLTEHINSEVGLGTITNIDSAKEWLRNSFLYQRIQQYPEHYSIGKDGNQTWQLVESSESDADSLVSTEFGDIMSKFYIRQSTMSLILKLPEKATLRDMLDALSAAEEFADIKIRKGEKQIYNKLKTQDAIRFKMKKVDKVADKISLIIQAILGGISLSDPEYKNGDNQPSLEAVTVFRHITRISRGE